MLIQEQKILALLQIMVQNIILKCYFLQHFWRNLLLEILCWEVMVSQKTETYSVNFWKTNGLFLVRRGLSLGYNLENKEGEQNKLPRIVIINMCIWDNDMSIFTSDYVAFLSLTQLFLDTYIWSI